MGGKRKLGHLECELALLYAWLGFPKVNHAWEQMGDPNYRDDCMDLMRCWYAYY